jgi:predicted TIM-barrel fold metal-dependent hydrolase
MYQGRLISSDDHVMEPPDLWTSRTDKRHRDRAPRVVREEAADWWVCDGMKLLSFGPGSQAGKRFEAPEKLTPLGRAEAVRPGGYDPLARLKDMDQDGVDVTVVYPSVAVAIYHIHDTTLLTPLARAYNDWLADFCSAAPRRLKGIGMLNAEDVPGAVAELQRCAKLGLAGALVQTYLPEGASYMDPAFDPLWAAAQDMDVPLALHVGANRPGPEQQMSKGSIRRSFMATYDHWVRISLGDMVFGGVFERFPRLRMGSIEHDLGWVPYWLDRMDYVYTQKVRRAGDLVFKDGMLPSGFWRRNCFVSFQDDALGVRLRERIGVENMLWGSDYPHVESTFPRSRQILDEVLSPCSEDERQRIVCGNAARIYKLA